MCCCKRKEQCRRLICSHWPFKQDETVLWLRHTGWCLHWKIELVQYKVTVLHQSCSNLTLILWICRRGSLCHFGLMIYYRTLLVTGNWNSADLLLNCGWGSFLLKTEADYLNEMAADLEMYRIQYVISKRWAQTAAICHKLLLLLAALHSNMWPNLDEQPLSKYRVEWCHF